MDTIVHALLLLFFCHSIFSPQFRLHSHPHTLPPISFIYPEFNVRHAVAEFMHKWLTFMNMKNLSEIRFCTHTHTYIDPRTPTHLYIGCTDVIRNAKNSWVKKEIIRTRYWWRINDTCTHTHAHFSATSLTKSTQIRKLKKRDHRIHVSSEQKRG